MQHLDFRLEIKGFIGTGSYDNTTSYYKDFWEYDTASDTWTKKADFGGVARGGACGFSVGNKGYVCFGQDSNLTPYPDMWEYDRTTNAWAQKTNLPDAYSAVVAASGFVIGSNIYVGTGQAQDSTNFQSIDVKTFWKYNTTNNSWSEEAKFLGVARVLSSAFAIADSGYIGFGTDTLSNFYNDWYKFYPDTLTAINELSPVVNSISVYPNPSDGEFTIVSSALIGQSLVEVYNVLGERVYSQFFTSGSLFHVDLGNQPSGMYVIKLTNYNSIAYNRIIIN